MAKKAKQSTESSTDKNKKGLGRPKPMTPKAGVKKAVTNK